MSDAPKEYFTQVPNSVLERAATLKLNGTQFRILLVVWRYTFGFHRDGHSLSISFISEAIGTHKNIVQREVQAMIERRVLTSIAGSGRRSRVIFFNSNFDEWDVASDNQLVVTTKTDDSALRQPISCQKDSVVTTNQLSKKEISSLKKKELNYLKDMSETEGQEPMDKKEKIQFIDTVFLTQLEYDRLCEEFGKDAVDNCIEALDEWQTNNPKKAKKDHNKTLRVWIKKDRARYTQIVAHKNQRQSKTDSNFDFLKNKYGGEEVGRKRIDVTPSQSLLGLSE